MLSALRPVLLVTVLVLGLQAQAANGPSTAPADSEKVESTARPVKPKPSTHPRKVDKDKATPSAPQPDTTKAPLPQAQMVQLSPPTLQAPAPTEPPPQAAAATAAPTPPGSPWRAWQPPLAAAVLMLVIAFKRQGGST